MNQLVVEQVRRRISFMRSWCLEESAAALDVEGMVIVMKCGVLKDGKFTNDLKEAEAPGWIHKWQWMGAA